MWLVYILFVLLFGTPAAGVDSELNEVMIEQLESS